jgi:hypothetical protein
VVWPDGVPKVETLSAFQKAYATKGFEICEDGHREEGYLKIAFYEKAGLLTHVAREEPSGRWGSKLGPWIDIQHHTPQALEDENGVGEYGQVVGYMKRPV